MYKDNEQLPSLAIKTKAILLNSAFLIYVLQFFIYSWGRKLFGKGTTLPKSIAQTTNQNAIFRTTSIHVYWRLCTTVS
jgi:hypothetical protein